MRDPELDPLRRSSGRAVHESVRLRLTSFLPGSYRPGVQSDFNQRTFQVRFSGLCSRWGTACITGLVWGAGCLFVQGQTTGNNEWAWIAGSNTGGQTPGVYGQLALPAPANTPGERMSTVNWTDAEGNLWLFGNNPGTHAAGKVGFLDDVWKFNTAFQQWIWRAGSSKLQASGTYGWSGLPAVRPVERPPLPSPPRRLRQPPLPIRICHGFRGAGGGGATLAGILLLGLPARRRRLALFGILLVLIPAALVVTSCGGGGTAAGGGGGSTTNPGTTPGNYTFTVTGQSGSISQSATVILAVQ